MVVVGGVVGSVLCYVGFVFGIGSVVGGDVIVGLNVGVMYLLLVGVVFFWCLDYGVG